MNFLSSSLKIYLFRNSFLLLISLPQIGWAQVIKKIGYVESGTASYYEDDRGGAVTRNGERYNMHALEGAHRYIAYGSLVKVTNTENEQSVIIRINDRPYTQTRVLDLTLAAAKALGIPPQKTAKVKLEVVALDVSRKEHELRAQQLQVANLYPEAFAERLSATPGKTPAKATYQKATYEALKTKPEAELAALFKPVGAYLPDGQAATPKGFGIQVGSFTNVTTALQQCADWVNLGISGVYVQAGWANGQKIYRLLIGEFDTKEAAKPLEDFVKVKKPNAFIKAHY
jgi:rare lipoprotein A